MLDRISELSRETVRGETTIAELGTGPLESLLGDEEAAQYVLASTSAIEHTVDGQPTSIEPDDGHGAYLVVTDHRLYALLGDEPTTAALTLALGAVSRSALDDGLLRTTLTVRTPTEAVVFHPIDAEQAAAAEAYVDRVGSCWSELATALDDARAGLDALREAIEASDAVDRHRQHARARLSKAYHCATQADDAPTAAMRAQIEPVEDELDRLCAVATADEVETRLEAARSAHEDGDYETAFETLVAAGESLDEASETDDIENRFEALRETHDELAATFLERAEQRCRDALDAATPPERVDAWEDALDRYRAAVAAGWTAAAGVTEAMVRFQLVWVVDRCVDALATAAAELAAQGDDRGEGHTDAADYYERALERLRRAEQLSDAHPEAGDSFADRIDALETKAERAQWQWGGED
ncbi:hypothetical protein [Halomicrobium sp. LC1Hm]|uniref:hypothetical protein n=1 Tax=Halomicrobium sp. LC1Hm TaxID=2610902 RepID=UPI0012985525|nr:hypothetical protein [Halomicrobium sp. LC1Hm]QGA81497.1 Uncharacterized protein LC1Hm_0433 [Halomicrobium sp. LC1Hm]